MSEQEPGKQQSPRPPRGPALSPRAYFGHASRAASGGQRAGISEEPETDEASPNGPLIYSAGDPALRLFPGFVLPLEPTTPLTGAIATLTRIRDGEHERLFIDLGTSLVRVAPQRDDAAGMQRLVLSRTQSAETYSGLLASLRYVNDAPAPTRGARWITLEIVDASGVARAVAAAQLSVGEAPAEVIQPDAASPEEPVPDVAALAAAAPAAGDPAPAAPPAEPQSAPANEADKRIVFGETVSFHAGDDYTVFWWPTRLPERARRAPQAQGPAPGAAAGSYFSAGGAVYRLFETPPGPATAPDAGPPARGPPAAAPAPASAPVSAPAASSAALSAQTPRAANDRAPVPQRAANDGVWVPGRGVPPPGFAAAPMLRLEDIFGSDMQDAIARRLIDMRIASAGG